MTDERQPTPASHAGADEVQGSSGESESGLSAIGSTIVDAEGRQAFAVDELAIVLSHYRIGLINTIKQFKRGSRKAPKLVIRSDSGLYLLKRRAHGRDDPFKVAFTHGVQLRLAEQGFPLPRLIGTRRENNSMVQFQGQVYELFEFIKGGSYDKSIKATEEAGRTLAKFHTMLADYKPHYQPPRGTYHAAPTAFSAIQALPEALCKPSDDRQPLQTPAANELAEHVHEVYRSAADKVEQLGLRDWSMQIGHSDWHPGNMLFDGPEIVAVIDYDSARLMQRIIDVANGALQFSVLRTQDEIDRWPDHTDMDRYRAFFRGYASVAGEALRVIERQVLPWLMIQAMIAESVIPVSVTGRFSQINGAAFLQMVLRKAHWIELHATELIEAADV